MAPPPGAPRARFALAAASGFAGRCRFEEGCDFWVDGGRAVILPHPVRLYGGPRWVEQVEFGMMMRGGSSYICLYWWSAMRFSALGIAYSC